MSTDELPWRKDAACSGVNPELFFPGYKDPAIAAKRVCAKCEVKEPCLTTALKNPEEQGVWGGTTEKDRAQIRRKRNR